MHRHSDENRLLTPTAGTTHAASQLYFYCDFFLWWFSRFSFVFRTRPDPIQSINRMGRNAIRLLGSMLLAFELMATAFDGNEFIEKVNYLRLLVWLPIGIAMTYEKPSLRNNIPA